MKHENKSEMDDVQKLNAIGSADALLLIGLFLQEIYQAFTYDAFRYIEVSKSILDYCWGTSMICFIIGVWLMSKAANLFKN